ncbi:MAG TPA: pyrroloquinoline quinone biosynthesis protein PqqE [Candidatus Obscuribacterales bacterium]
MVPGAQVVAPYALLAELTHRCPLACVYCSNPLALQTGSKELPREDWLRVIQEAEDLGILQLHLSGGEPLLREDLEDLIRRAAEAGLYTNLITSGLGLDAERADSLARSGLNSVQLSLQAADAGLSDVIAGRASFARKQQAADAVRAAGLPLAMNVVLHRHNLDQIENIIDTCVAWGAERIELANVQFYNWALLNRDYLLPARDQLASAEEIYIRKKNELCGKIELIWVVSDYYEQFPKPCMGGWGRVQLTIAPDGTVLPCPVASTIAGMDFESVRDKSLRSIWEESPAFNKFRGFDWMPEPCRSCDRRAIDFGGCRCQAFALAGSADATDPVCHLSPHHHLVESALALLPGHDQQAGPLQEFRTMRYRRRGV